MGSRRRVAVPLIVVATMVATLGPIRAGARTGPPNRGQAGGAAAAAAGVTFTVNTTADFDDPTPDGVCIQLSQCSLREAIREADATPVTDTIAFAIAAADARISPASPLPAVTEPIVIDGSTQPGYRGLPLIVLDGSGAGVGATGLDLRAGASTIRALTVQSFSGDGIAISGPGGNVIQSNHIGTDVRGIANEGNEGDGISIFDSPNNVIGAGTPGIANVEPGNVISGNGGTGVRVTGSGQDNLVAGNLIGTDATGLAALGNIGDGVFVQARNTRIGASADGNVISANGRDGLHVQSVGGAKADDALIQDNLIGTDASGEGALPNIRHGVFLGGGSSDALVLDDTVAFNQGDGVSIPGGSNNRVDGARIHDNGDLGIDLGPNGVTLNDAGDGDSGANGLQNFPEIASVVLSPSSLQVNGTIGTTANTTASIHVFVWRECDGITGEGAVEIGSDGITTNGAGNANFSVDASHQFAGRVLTAVATTPAGTSEFSECFTIPFAHTFTVNTTADNGDATPDGACNDGANHCSLREAIQEANAAPGEDLVAFAIPGAGVHTISPASALPPLTDMATVDGTIQPGFVSTPLIEIRGTSAGTGTDGLVVAAGPSVIRGLAINRFNGDGIEISASNLNAIERNFIGTDPAGTTDLGNGGNGVNVGTAINTIGGPGLGNVISGNQQAGILLTDSLNDVFGNRIGTDVTGSAALGNSGDGVRATDNLNHIGDAGPALRNVISANAGDGVEIATSAVTVKGNYIGTDALGTADLGNGSDGVRLSGSGIASQIRDNVICGNGLSGFEITQTPGNGTPNTVAGNLIGLGADGSTALPNTLSGVRAVNTGKVLVGGVRPGDANVISRNPLMGIDVTTSSEVTVQGNLIGLDAAGATAAPNHLLGISVSDSSGVTVGGTAPTAGNVVSGNENGGIRIINGSEETTLQGNLVGTDVTGTVAVGNALQGVVISDAHDNTVGGTGAGTRNVISGNASGIQIHEADSTGNAIQGNLIGLDVSGTQDVGNAGDGIAIFASANGNVVGGTAAGAGNTIAGNGDEGISLTAGPNQVFGNVIGLATRNQVAPGGGVPNDGNGIEIGATGNTIGGAGPGESNTITNNGAAGVLVSSGTGNRIRGNSIVANFGLGIDLAPAGVTGNDFDDSDVGPNDKQNFPTLSGAVSDAASSSVPGFFQGASGVTLQLDFYATAGCDPSGNGEGQRFLGTQQVTTSGGGFASFVASLGALRPGELVTSTATDGSGNTSELSNCVRSVITGGGSVAGDFDGDGFEDLAIGVPGETPTFSAGAGSGTVVVVPGAADGLHPAESAILQQGSNGVKDQPEGGDAFGSALAVGDFNGDGRDDLVVGVPGEDVGSIVDAGAVNVIYGTETGPGGGKNQLFTQNTTNVTNNSEKGDGFGSSLAVGNLGKSSRPDLAIGVPGEGVSEHPKAGGVNVLYGASSGLATTDNQFWSQDPIDVLGLAADGDAFGTALAAKNLGHSAQADLAVGVPGEDVNSKADAGAVAVIYGSTTGLTSAGNERWTQDSANVLEGAEPEDRFGAALAAGDFGNGTPADLAVGVPGEDLSAPDAGLVDVLYGTANGLATAGNQVWSLDDPGVPGSAGGGDRFGSALLAVNLGNGSQADLAVGVPGAGVVVIPAAGIVAVIFGSANGLTATGSATLTEGQSGPDTPEAGDGFGAALGAGNYGNGNAVDLAIGAPGEDTAAGLVAVMFGTSSGPGTTGAVQLKQGSGGLGDTADAGDRFGQAAA